MSWMEFINLKAKRLQTSRDKPVSWMEFINLKAKRLQTSRDKLVH